MKNKSFDNYTELEIIKKNDNYLITTNTFLIFLAVSYGFSIVGAILLFINQIIVGGILLLIFASLTIFIAYIIFKLFLSFLFDVKMIRNKLYHLDNTSIYRYYNNDLSDVPKYDGNNIDIEKT